jgi:hypothetical protein
MIYQVTTYSDNSTKAFTNAASLASEILHITGNSEESQNVLEWATTPVFGGFRYDHSDFNVVIIGQDD